MTDEQKSDGMEERVRHAAENALLVFFSRWSTIFLVPIILAVGTWIVTNIQSLNIAVYGLQQQMVLQAKLNDEQMSGINRSVDLRFGTIETRFGAVETRVGRLESQYDIQSRKSSQFPQ